MTTHHDASASFSGDITASAVDLEMLSIEDLTGTADLDAAGNCFGTLGSFGCPACFGTLGSFT